MRGLPNLTGRVEHGRRVRLRLFVPVNRLCQLTKDGAQEQCCLRRFHRLGTAEVAALAGDPNSTRVGREILKASTFVPADSAAAT